MPRGRGDHIIAAIRIVFGLALAIVLALLVWTISSEYAQHSLKARGHAQQYAKDTPDRVQRACAGREAAALYECVAKEIEATREDQRSEYDLSAQNQMADWAFWMMVATIVTALLTGWALFYIKRTLDATREAVEDTSEATLAMKEANKITRDIMELEHRPILEFMGFAIEPFSRQDGPFPIAMLVARWRNIGAMPALVTSTKIWRAYTLGNPTPERVAALRACPPSQSQGRGLHLIARDTVHEGPRVSFGGLSVIPPGMHPESIERAFLAEDAGNMALLIAKVTYKSAIGSSREFETEQVIGIAPLWGDTGMRTDDFGIGPPHELNMT